MPCKQGKCAYILFLYARGVFSELIKVRAEKLQQKRLRKICATLTPAKGGRELTFMRGNVVLHHSEGRFGYDVFELARVRVRVDCVYAVEL